jgi:hypothetical protein
MQAARPSTNLVPRKRCQIIVLPTDLSQLALKILDNLAVVALLLRH